MALSFGCHPQLPSGDSNAAKAAVSFLGQLAGAGRIAAGGGDRVRLFR